jgi:hypothetical protein
MATVSEVKSTTLSGLNHIDALLGNLPQWNYQTSGGNTLYYTFSTSGGLETGNSSILSTPQAFSASQQAATRGAMAYVAKLTGINFVETSDTTLAKVHFANANINGSGTTGLDSSHYSYSYNSTQTVTKFTSSSYVYLDNKEWAGMNANLSAGTQGYETLLHEIGHMLGLKHTFEGTIRLPSAQDNTNFSLMSYTHAGGVHSTFSEYDVAALKWLYGGDGLGGQYGVNSTTGGRYFTGTSLADTLNGTSVADKLEGGKGNDVLNGGGGLDTAVFNGLSSAYSVVKTGASTWSVSGADGADRLSNIELLQFSDRTITLSTTPLSGAAAASTTMSVITSPVGAGADVAGAGSYASVPHDHGAPAHGDDFVQLVGQRGHFAEHHFA